MALYEALWGKAPFEGDTAARLAESVLQGSVRPSAAERRLPSELDRIVRRGLAVEPAHRYASMDELLAALSAVLRPRRRKLMTAAALLSLICVTGLIVRLERNAGQQWRRANDQARRVDAMTLLAAARAQSDPTVAAAFVREIPDLAITPMLLHANDELFRAPLSYAILRGHSGWVTSLAFGAGGASVLSGSPDSTVRLWNADDSAEPVVLRGDGDAVASVALGANGHILTGDLLDGNVFAWPATISRPPVVAKGPPCNAESFAFSADGTKAVTGCLDGRAFVWNLDGSGVPVVLHDHGQLGAVAISQDGRKVVTGSYLKSASVWNADGSGIPVVLRHEEVVLAVAFSPDGQKVLTGSVDAMARVWNADGSGTPIALKGHAGPVFAVAFSADGKTVITGSSDMTARLWKADGATWTPFPRPPGWLTDSRAPYVLRGHSGAVLSVALSRDGKTALTGSDDKTVRVWNLEIGVIGGGARRDWFAWTLSTYCPSVDERVRFLGQPAADARRAEEVCLRTMRACHSSDWSVKGCEEAVSDVPRRHGQSLVIHKLASGIQPFSRILSARVPSLSSSFWVASSRSMATAWSCSSPASLPPFGCRRRPSASEAIAMASACRASARLESRARIFS